MPARNQWPQPEKKKTPYSGELLEPITQTLSPHATTAERRAAEVGLLERWKRKVGLHLAPHYKLDASDPNFQFKLLIALTQDHVPGLRMAILPPKPLGPTVWTDEVNLKFIECVERLKREKPSRDATAALRIIQQKNLYTEFLPEQAEGEPPYHFELRNLQNKLSQARAKAEPTNVNPKLLERLTGVLRVDGDDPARISFHQDEGRLLIGENHDPRSSSLNGDSADNGDSNEELP